MRQMATLETSGVSSTTSKRSEEIASIFETRATGFCVHALVLGSLALLPQLGKIPMAVVSGIFLYLGRKVRYQLVDDVMSFLGGGEGRDGGQICVSPDRLYHWLC